MDRTPKPRETARGVDALKRTTAFKGGMTMKKFCITIALLSTASPALADEIKLKPIIDARLRYESVDQVPLTSDAQAITARVRTGVEAKSKAFAVLVEAEGTLALSEKYNSGLNGKAAFPIVADPENIELNRAQV
jgi:hypothetical protein